MHLHIYSQSKHSLKPRIVKPSVSFSYPPYHLDPWAGDTSDLLHDEASISHSGAFKHEE